MDYSKWKGNILYQMIDSFDKTLQHYVPLSGYKAPVDVKVLDIGCGMCTESGIVARYFENRGRSCEFVGIDTDIDPRIVYDFVDRSGRKSYEFVSGDARNMRYLMGEKKFDVVIARNPNLLKRRGEDWRDVLEEAKYMVSEDNLFISTLLMEEDWGMSGKLLDEVEYKVLIGERNKHAIRVPGNDEFYDGWVVLAKIPAKK